MSFVWKATMIRVTINGCFDGLHPGHLFSLGYALAQGTELVVGINSDEYIIRKKGRLLVPAEQRVKALMDLRFIKDVLVFPEDDPVQFIMWAQPQVHCTGLEYYHTAAEEPWCKIWGIKMVYIPRVGDWSSTKIRRERETEHEV